MGSSPASGGFGSVCVFCGARSGTDPRFLAAASSLGAELARREARLVYGGGSVGLMGEVSTSAHASGGKVLGVIPVALEAVEISGASVGEVRVVADMHERKALMARESDAFVALPGGFGTLEELLEVITWQQLGYHAKPVGVLNIEGYFDAFLAFLDHAVRSGFISPEARKILVTGDSPAALLDALEKSATALASRAGPPGASEGKARLI